MSVNTRPIDVGTRLEHSDTMETDVIAYFSPSMGRLAAEIRYLTGLAPKLRFWGPKGAKAVAGWGHKSTACRARRIAASSTLPYLAFEDGFLRSVRPGKAQAPASLVMDRTGIYYDARQSNDLESLLERGTYFEAGRQAARELITLLARHQLSKYNFGRDRFNDFTPPVGKPLVIIVDQTLGDESVSGSLSNAADFAAMAEAAVAENPGACVVARLHPETVLGNKRGYLVETARRLSLPLLTEPVSPWCLFDLQPKVYTVSSQFGYEALLAGCAVTCFGVPFYAGWGLTDDRKATDRRTARRTVEELVDATFLQYCKYFDCWRRTPIDALTAIDQLAFLRRRFLDNDTRVVGYHIPRWKRAAVTAMLDGPNGPPLFVNSLKRAKTLVRQNNAVLAAWGVAAINLRKQFDQERMAVLAIEDGFLRSAGLGAAFTPPLSLVFDSTGLHYDSTTPSDIETLLREAEIGDHELTQARLLIERIIEQQITKYNLSATSVFPTITKGTNVVVVIGQVADDWAVKLGRPTSFAESDNVNAILLRRVREANLDSFVIFKPHPDVETMFRLGALQPEEEKWADAIVRGVSIAEVLSVAHRLETYSSLAGFEALLRHVEVTTHGSPFYAGWGLTKDRVQQPRRGRTRSLEELVAISLIRYPRYWDPVSGLVCPPDVAIDRIVAQKNIKASLLPWVRTLAGRLVVLVRRAVSV